MIVGLFFLKFAVIFFMLWIISCIVSSVLSKEGEFSSKNIQEELGDNLELVTKWVGRIFTAMFASWITCVFIGLSTTILTH